MLRILSLLLFFCVLVLGVSFAGMNSSPVVIDYYLGRGEFPLSLLLVGAFALGAVMGLIAGGFALVRARYSVHRVHRDLERAEKELRNLRNGPLKELA